MVGEVTLSGVSEVSDYESGLTFMKFSPLTPLSTLIGGGGGLQKE